jgi:hypothetical protein
MASAEVRLYLPIGSAVVTDASGRVAVTADTQNWRVVSCAIYTNRALNTAIIDGRDVPVSLNRSWAQSMDSH